MTREYIRVLAAFVFGAMLALLVAFPAKAGHEEWCHFDQGVPGEQRGSISKGHGHEHHEHDFLIETEEDRERCLGTTTTTTSTPETTTTTEEEPSETTTTTQTSEPSLTSTTKPEATTTSSDSTTSSTVSEDTTTTTISTETTSTTPAELPFTGPNLLVLTGLALALVATGTYLLRKRGDKGGDKDGGGWKSVLEDW